MENSPTQPSQQNPEETETEPLGTEPLETEPLDTEPPEHEMEKVESNETNGNDSPSNTPSKTSGQGHDDEHTLANGDILTDGNRRLVERRMTQIENAYDGDEESNNQEDDSGHPNPPPLEPHPNPPPLEPHNGSQNGEHVEGPRETNDESRQEENVEEGEQVISYFF